AVPPGPINLKLAVLIVKGSIASLKVALMVWLIGTAVAASAGTVALTVGRVVSGVAPVVKLQLKSVASALPARSLAPVVTVAVYAVRGARLPAGVKVAVTPASATVPATVAAPCFKVKLAVLIVKGSIASLKMAAILPLMATPVAALAGTAALTVGRVVSGVAPVVKLQTKFAASALPARSLAPVVTVAVNVVRGARLPAGVKVAVTPA